jgi:hypothetical protein
MIPLGAITGGVHHKTMHNPHHPACQADAMRRALAVASIALVVAISTTACAATFAPTPTQDAAARVADFGVHTPSADAVHVAEWVADSRDNAGVDFIIVDKKHAALLVFDANAHLLGLTPVLLGGATGDDSVPGIGTRPMTEVRPDERTTPAGRFVGELGRNASGEDIVWVDYDAAVSMHRVRANNPKERRLERLATPSIDDNRISYGCINVPVAFYETYIRPAFATRRAIVYVLPEVKTVQQVFGSHDVAATRARLLQR